MTDHRRVGEEQLALEILPDAPSLLKEVVESVIQQAPGVEVTEHIGDARTKATTGAPGNETTTSPGPSGPGWIS